MSSKLSDSPLENRAQRQLADRIGEENDQFGTVPSNEVVEIQPIESFQLSADLRHVLQKEQRRELEQILQEVCEINNEFVDERTVEAETCLELSDESRKLSERCIKWFATFIAERLSKPNHQDRDSAIGRFLRLNAEFERFFSPYFNRPNSIGYVFFDQPTQYARFEYFSRVFSAYFSKIYGQPCFNLEAIDRDPHLIPDLHAWYTKCATDGCWHLDRFFPFLELLAESPDIKSNAESRRSKSDQTIRKELTSIAEDIKCMRPFLAGSNPSAFIAEIGGRFIGLRWKLRYGIAQLCIGESRDVVVREMNSPKLTPVSLPSTTIRHDGLLADICCPWVTTESWSNPDGMLLSLDILERVRDLLFHSYDQIDFETIRRKALAGEITPEAEDLSLAVAADAYERRQSDIPVEISINAVPSPDEAIGSNRENTTELPLRHNRPRSMRRQSLLNLLTRHFGCEVSRAKGSEIKVYREGGRIFTLGRHTQEVAAERVRLLLQRLGISITDWIKAVYS